MRDPHVTALYNSVSTGDGIEFGSPPAYVFDNHVGRFAIDQLKLTVRPVAHHASTAVARTVVGPFLRAWEVYTDLTRNIGSIRFSFTSADVIDRDPPPPNSGVTIEVGVGELLVLGEFATVFVTQNAYPPAPSAFDATPEVELAHARWVAHRAHHEPLQAMAYSVLTLIEAMAGGRQNAAKLFSVDVNILKEIGRLSSTKGDGATARKLKSLVSLQPLTGGESSWLDAAVRRLIQRVGEHSGGAPLTRIERRDLPPE